MMEEESFPAAFGAAYARCTGMDTGDEAAGSDAAGPAEE
jgi:hypothetical protein